MTLVVDASVAVKWFIIEPVRPEARRLLDREQRLIAPELLVAEVVNVLWKRVISGAIARSQAADAARELPQMLAELCPLVGLAARALAIADELRHPAYDCFYLALAASARCARLITATGAFRGQRHLGSAHDHALA